MSTRGETAREAAAIVGSLVAVVAAAALLLRGLDAAPRLLGGERPGVVRVQSLDAAERAYGERLLLPSFFPETLRWPPAMVQVYAGPPAATAVTFLSRGDATEGLVLYEAHGARASIPMVLMPAGLVLHRVDVPMADGEATLYRVRMPDGALRTDLVWHRADLAVALRYAGAADELLAIARSLHRRRP